MEKSALAGEGRGARPPPFTVVTIMYKIAVYAPAEMADTLPLFHLYSYMYSVVLSYPIFARPKASSFCLIRSKFS
jgi:hypothetical protein